MSVVARQLAADALGAGRWRVDLELARTDSAAVAAGPVGGVSLSSVKADSPLARVETLAAPMPGERARWSVVISLEEARPMESPAVYELSSGDAGGWTARIEIAPNADEPSPDADSRTTAGAPRTDIDYRARDFDALRTMMLSLIAEHVPGVLLGQPVSQSAALVEELAYLGDAMSYHQDALATEAYLVTARRRLSVTRHAALLDYPVFEGMSARGWIRVEVAEAMRLPARTQFLTRVSGLPPHLDENQLTLASATGALVFETLEEVWLEPHEETLPLAAGRHGSGRLAAGATRATVAGRSNSLAPGALALLEPVSGDTGIGHIVRLAAVRELPIPADDEGADQVTELEWLPPDALPADPLLTEVALQVRMGNLVLVEQGSTQPAVRLDPPVAGVRFRPRLPHRHTTFSAGLPGALRSPTAAEMLVPDGVLPRPAVEVWEEIGPYRRTWNERPSLLESGPLSPDFVVEVESDGEASLRFGDGVNGTVPPPGARLMARQRVGSGVEGNVGHDTIVHALVDGDRLLRVTNPSAARGGAEPETLASVKLNAPEAFRVTQRVVTESDYVAQAVLVPGVSDAAAAIASNGSWPLAVVYIHTASWSTPIGQLAERVRAELRARQPAGVDLEVHRALAMPVAIEVEVTAAAGWDLNALGASIDRALRSAFLASGRFGFGNALYRSEVVTVVAAVPGVTDASVRRFGSVSEAGVDSAREALLPPFGYIIRIDNDPVRPAMGSIVYTFGPSR